MANRHEARNTNAGQPIGRRAELVPEMRREYMATKGLEYFREWVDAGMPRRTAGERS